jgi:hypothetical protein
MVQGSLHPKLHVEEELVQRLHRCCSGLGRPLHVAGINRTADLVAPMPLIEPAKCNKGYALLVVLFIPVDLCCRGGQARNLH